MKSLNRMNCLSTGAVFAWVVLALPGVVHAEAVVSAGNKPVPTVLHPVSQKVGVPVGVAYSVAGRYAVGTPLTIRLALTPQEAMTGMRIEIPETDSFVVDVDASRLAITRPVALRPYTLDVQVTPRRAGVVFRFHVVAERADARFASVFNIDLRRPNTKPSNPAQRKVPARRE